MNKKSPLSAFLTAIMVGGLVLVSVMRFGTVQAATEVTGIISSDSTWTKANSPYTLTGPVKVNNEVTLTIEAGATVNLNGYYIQLDGTLHAIGSNDYPIYLSDGKITFSQNSSSWNEKTRSGSIIENSILNSNSITIEIWNTSPKINSNSITGSIIVNGYHPTMPQWAEASPIISNNNISRSGHSTAIQNGGAPSIINNTIKGGITSFGYGLTVILNNIIEGSGACGIQADSVPDRISDNIISGFGIGIRAGVSTIIERNLIINNHDGILMWINADPVIRNNTIANNTNGISLPGYSGGSKINYHNIQVNYNNIYDNSEYNINLYTYEAHAKDDVNATYNWWGTTDKSAIDDAIHDFSDDFDLGTVNFVPFLTEQNLEATPDLNAPIPTPTTSPSPSPTASPDQTPKPTPKEPQTLQSEAIVGAVIVVAVFGAGLGLLIYLIKRK